MTIKNIPTVLINRSKALTSMSCIGGSTEASHTSLEKETLSGYVWSNHPSKTLRLGIDGRIVQGASHRPWHADFETHVSLSMFSNQDLGKSRQRLFSHVVRNYFLEKAKVNVNAGFIGCTNCVGFWQLLTPKVNIISDQKIHLNNWLVVHTKVQCD